MEGRNPLFSRVSTPPLMSLVERKVGWGWGGRGGGGELMWVAVFGIQPLLGGGKKRKLLLVVGFLRLLPGLSTS